MVTEEELLNAGFEYKGEWNNRFYYKKCDFELVDHYGIYRSNKNNLSGFGKELKTIDEINLAFNKWAKSSIKRCNDMIAKYENKKELIESVLS